MKRIETYIVLFIFCLGQIFQVFSSPKFSEGIELYNKGDYKEAAQIFDDEIKLSPNDISAYYNLGLSKMEINKMGEAIWAFEKVLSFNPRDNEAKEKIIECYELLNTNIEWSPRLNAAESVLYGISPDSWSLLAIFSSLIICLVVFINQLAKYDIKKITRLLGFLFGFLLVLSIIMGMLVHNYYDQNKYAIVTQKTIPTFIEKNKPSEMTLQEGTQLHILNNIDSEYSLVISTNGDEYLVMIKHLDFI